MKSLALLTSAVIFAHCPADKQKLFHDVVNPADILCYVTKHNLGVMAEPDTPCPAKLDVENVVDGTLRKYKADWSNINALTVVFTSSYILCGNPLSESHACTEMSHFNSTGVVRFGLGWRDDLRWVLTEKVYHSRGKVAPKPFEPHNFGPLQ